MKKKATALIIVTIIVLSTLTSSFAYLTLSNQPDEKTQPSPTSTVTPSPSPPSATPNQENKPSTSFQPKPTPHTSTSLPYPIPSPTPNTVSDSSYPEGGEVLLPLGVFGIISPNNQTYDTSALFLNVSANTLAPIAKDASLSYSLDGGPRIPIALELKQSTKIQASISSSVALPPLANGSHIIVLYGDFPSVSKRGKVTVYFDIEAV
jgi:hypothetical protein